MPVAEADATVARAIGGLIQLCLETGIDDSHGAGHAAAVLHHAEAAVAAAAQPLSEARALAVRLAALLHDADDKKYFPKTCRTYANARQIMSDAGASTSETRPVHPLTAGHTPKSADASPTTARPPPVHNRLTTRSPLVHGHPRRPQLSIGAAAPTTTTRPQPPVHNHYPFATSPPSVRHPSATRPPVLTAHPRHPQLPIGAASRPQRIKHGALQNRRSPRPPPSDLPSSP